ncbi:restriction endonuclease subunit S [Methylomonas sp. EFPC3]|uniref:restriction endonuclease subunit S n=1 Tax=Methylomonas sp. EFPC3 TaxID=3021710 RepID=UPI002415AB07|nr:restriction endonuclease subunit S [Methylomonas sp. EFPC3]WFP50372.1 restriction endonuclease subunit S [Methylomonas sp. EFPC3]
MIEQLAALPTYEAYKDSGVEWLGEIPAHWNLTRLSTRFEERRQKVSDKDFLPLSVTKNGILPQLDSAAKSNDGDNRKLVKKGDFVINSRSDRKGSSGVSDRDGSVSLINIVLTPNGIDSQYCNFLLKSYAFIEEFYRMGHGIVADLWTTRYDEMKAVILGVPPLLEQTAIADFLDRKTAQIDQAVAIKEQQIDLLKERKQILIQNAVTRGLDSNVPMRDSGVDWIGEVPAHWEVTRLKYIFSETNERTKTGQEVLFSLRMEQGLVPHNDVSDKHIADDNLIDYKIIRPGQMIMNRMRAAIGIFGLADKFGLVSPDYAVFNIGQNAFPEYFLRLFKTPLIGEQFRLNSKGLGTGSSGFMRLYTENFGDIKVSLPSKEEQVNIVTYIETQSAKIDQAIAIQQQQIDKLKEYKATLINSAVTGKIRIPEVAA